MKAIALKKSSQIQRGSTSIFDSERGSYCKEKQYLVGIWNLNPTHLALTCTDMSEPCIWRVRTMLSAIVRTRHIHGSDMYIHLSSWWKCIDMYIHQVYDAARQSFLNLRNPNHLFPRAIMDCLREAKFFLQTHCEIRSQRRYSCLKLHARLKWDFRFVQNE